MSDAAKRADGPALLQQAKAILPRAVASYSGFRVAAALEDLEGVVHPGVNVESASLGLTLCAERNALFGALARGATKFGRLAIAADRARPVLPCGACRQVLMEHAPGLLLVLESPDGRVEEIPLRDLLPRPFLSWSREP
ncbi:MAG TPA: cytidine deaminase [Candidatus Eisenbacteria bacterium]|nr:cytidine deaminase [Candidatus Eisenbacteria bacterium]